MQAQRPGRLDPIEINETSLVQNREVAGLGDLVHHTAQNRTPLGGGGIAAQDVERKARQALANDIGTPARLPGEKSRLLEKCQRAVQCGLGKIRRLHELGQRHRAPGTRQHFEDGKGLESRGRFLRDLRGSPPAMTKPGCSRWVTRAFRVSGMKRCFMRGSILALGLGSGDTSHPPRQIVSFDEINARSPHAVPSENGSFGSAGRDPRGQWCTTRIRDRGVSVHGRARHLSSRRHPASCPSRTSRERFTWPTAMRAHRESTAYASRRTARASLTSSPASPQPTGRTRRWSSSRPRPAR